MLFIITQPTPDPADYNEDEEVDETEEPATDEKQDKKDSVETSDGVKEDEAAAAAATEAELEEKGGEKPEPTAETEVSPIRLWKNV